MTISPESHEATQALNARLASGVLHVRVTKDGTDRVLSGWAGMVLRVKDFTPGLVGPVAHCIDLRYPRPESPTGYQTWSIGADGYEVV
jgi:hypothetical protein